MKAHKAHKEFRSSIRKDSTPSEAKAFGGVFRFKPIRPSRKRHKSKIMLKPYYANETDIPENLKAAYIAKNGRYELDELEKEHPVLAKNKELLSKNSTLTTENQRLNSEVTRLESAGLPEGKVAVEPDIEKLGTAAKAANLKVSEISTLKTEADTLRTQLTNSQKDAKLDAVADALGFKRAEFKKLAAGLDITEQAEGEGDKKTVKYLVKGKDAAGADITTDLSEHGDIKPFLGSLARDENDFQFVDQKSDKFNKTAGNIYDRIRADVKAQEETTAPKADLDKRFGLAT